MRMAYIYKYLNQLELKIHARAEQQNIHCGTQHSANNIPKT